MYCLRGEVGGESIVRSPLGTSLPPNMTYEHTTKSASINFLISGLMMEEYFQNGTYEWILCQVWAALVSFYLEAAYRFPFATFSDTEARECK